MMISVAAFVLIPGDFAQITPRYPAFRTHLARIGLVSPAAENAAGGRDFSKPPECHRRFGTEQTRLTPGPYIYCLRRLVRIP